LNAQSLSFIFRPGLKNSALASNAEVLLADGSVVKIRHNLSDRGLDFYQTPPCATHALIKAERDKQAAAGIQPIDLGPAAGKEFLTKANEVGWASVIKRSPENGAKLRQLSGN